MTEYDPVNHPAHYTQYEHEVIELTEQLDFCLGNAVKYILRAPFKGRQIEDLEKAKWYLNRLLGGDGEREYEPWSDDTRALAVTYKNPAVNTLFSYHKLCQAAIEATLARLDRMLVKSEVDALKAQLAVVTAERDRMREQLKKQAAPIPVTVQPPPFDPYQRYTPSLSSDSTRDIEHGC